MSIPVLILGDSGAGKSRSTKTFKPGEVEIINTDGKLLPYFNVQHDTLDVPAKIGEIFREKGGMKPLKADLIRSWINKHHEHKAVFVDDYGYALFEIYERFKLSDDERLDNGFAAYDMIVNRLSRQFREIQEDGDVDRIVYFVMHIEQDKFGKEKPLVMGKFVNDKYVLEGKVTCTLRAVRRGDEYGFVTNDGTLAKSPEDLFDEFIPNDLRAVDARIREAYHFKPLEAVKNDE